MSFAFDKKRQCLLLAIFLGVFFSTNLYAETRPGSLSAKFNAERAFKHVQKQVEFGHRPSGSAELQKTRDYLIESLRSYHFEVQEQAFTQKTPRGLTRFTNIVASLPRNFPASLVTDRRKRIILASHYDTKWLPSIQFVGANDSASSTGTLLEIARVVSEARFNPGTARIDFVFFDGEEAMEQYTETDGLYGSRYFVKELETQGMLSRIKALILLDMIGDRDLLVQIPQGDPNLVKGVFEAAQSLGFRNFFRVGLETLIDDHAPFVFEKVPAVNLIDFDYGPQNRYWHSADDTLDKISAQSLKIVGQTVLETLQKLSE